MDDDPSPAAARRLGPTSIDVSVTNRVGRLPLARERVVAIAERVLHGERARHAWLAITFATDREMRALNRQHFGHRGTTDIITLQHARTTPGAPVVGEIFISPVVARRNAEGAECSWREELARLTVHGVLHALGRDHPEGESRTTSPMWRRQERWVARLRDAGIW